VNPHEPHPSALPLRIFLIVAAATAMAAVILWMTRELDQGEAAAPAASQLRLASPDITIDAEADVFRAASGAFALGPLAPRERSAHPRNLTTFRFLRAFPGAPPRIPHALTPEEFRTGVCRTCHERGGYSTRFAAYVPVTPHPELGVCLQCHAGDDAFMGIGSAATDPNARCPQCHGPNGKVRPEARLT
jgi:nitrate reductase cytochrome c-type subunit